MIRRLGILLVLALTMAACAGAERDAVTVGETSISRAGLVDLVVAVNPGGPDELPPTLSAIEMRQIANQWALDAALEIALAEQGLVVGDDELEQINGQIDGAMAAFQIGELPPDSAGYEAFQRSLFVSPRTASLDQATRARVEELLNDVDVESRLGIADEGNLAADPTSGRLFVDPGMPYIVSR